MFRTSNPALNDRVFAAPGGATFGSDLSARTSTAGAMTLGGTIVKSGLLLGICAVTAVFAYGYFTNNPASIRLGALGSTIGGLVLGLIIGFVPRSAPFLSPVYAALQGAFLGALSLVFAAKFGPTIIFQGVTITFGIMAAVLIAFSFGLIRLSGTAMKVIAVATTGLMLVYLVQFVMRLMGWGTIPFIHESGPIGIGFSLFVITLASLNLVMDFQFVEQGVQSGAPKYMEWYAAFGLLVTLVWLYIEILRLLSKLQERR